MFTGLVEAVAPVAGILRLGHGARLKVSRPEGWEDLVDGESISVSGVCLTLAGIPRGAEPLAFDVSPETLAHTTLGAALRPGSRVNLERALKAQARLGGHFVAGHVDETVAVLEVTNEGTFRRVRFALPDSLSRWVVQKGSVALDGVSLTVAALDVGTFDVAVIPATWERTTIGDRRPGDLVNAEGDLLAKYVERLLGGRAGAGGETARDGRLFDLLGGR